MLFFREFRPIDSQQSSSHLFHHSTEEILLGGGVSACGLWLVLFGLTWAPCPHGVRTRGKKNGPALMSKANAAQSKRSPQTGRGEKADDNDEFDPLARPGAHPKKCPAISFCLCVLPQSAVWQSGPSPVQWFWMSTVYRIGKTASHPVSPPNLVS